MTHPVHAYYIGVSCSIYSLQSSNACTSSTSEPREKRGLLYIAHPVVVRRLHRLPGYRRVNYFRVSGCANTRLDTRYPPWACAKRVDASVSIETTFSAFLLLPRTVHVIFNPPARFKIISR